MAYTADEVLKAESGPITIPQGLKKDDKQLLSQRTVALPPPTAMHVPLGTQYLGSSPTKHRKGKLIKALEPRYCKSKQACWNNHGSSVCFRCVCLYKH